MPYPNPPIGRRAVLGWWLSFASLALPTPARADFLADWPTSSSPEPKIPPDSSAESFMGYRLVKYGNEAALSAPWREELKNPDSHVFKNFFLLKDDLSKRVLRYRLNNPEFIKRIRAAFDHYRKAPHLGPRDNALEAIWISHHWARFNYTYSNEAHQKLIPAGSYDKWHDPDEALKRGRMTNCADDAIAFLYGQLELGIPPEDTFYVMGSTRLDAKEGPQAHTLDHAWGVTRYKDTYVIATTLTPQSSERLFMADTAHMTTSEAAYRFIPAAIMNGKGEVWYVDSLGAAGTFLDTDISPARELYMHEQAPPSPWKPQP
jgi:hypothetical protein